MGKKKKGWAAVIQNPLILAILLLLLIRLGFLQFEEVERFFTMFVDKFKELR